MNGAFSGVSLRWEIAEGGKTESGVDGSKKERSCTAVGERFVVILCESVLSTVNAVWAKTAVYRSTSEPLLNQNRFHNDRFLQTSGRRTKRAQDQNDNY